MVWCSSGGACDFYPRSPCGERRFFSLLCILCLYISIHALLAESDFFLFIVYSMFVYFYPRSPCGERRPMDVPQNQTLDISIHALLAESDVTDAINGCNLDYISIHALLAESDYLYLGQQNPTRGISIHALLAESDGGGLLSFFDRTIFLSTLSLRRATAKVHKTVGHFCAYETNFMEIASSC